MTHHVYIVAHANGSTGEKPVKVGITSNLDGRLRALQTGSFRKLVYVMTLATPNREISSYMEAAFHSLQKDRRLEGEWFDIEVAEAMQLLGFYFDLAIQMEIPDRELADEAREASNLNHYKRLFKGQPV